MDRVVRGYLTMSPLAKIKQSGSPINPREQYVFPPLSESPGEGQSVPAPETSSDP